MRQETVTGPLEGIVGRLREAIAYSHNFATAKPNIGAKEREHIIGLCACLAAAADVIERSRTGDPIMGARTDAETKLLAAWSRYCETRQAAIVPHGRRAQAQREAERHEATNRLVEAACLVAWHMNEDRAATKFDAPAP